MSTVLIGQVLEYGNNVDTDVIIPARYLTTSDPKEYARHCMEDIDQNFIHKVKPGDMILAGTNFGCGSSREHAPIAIKESGISCVIAESFARIFFRNAINIGLPIVELKNARQYIHDGDKIKIDFENGTIQNLSSGSTFAVSPHPAFMQEIIGDGGLINMLKKQLK